MFVVSILSMVIGMYALYVRLFRFEGSNKQLSKESREKYLKNKFGLDLAIAVFLIGGISMLTLDIIQRIDIPMTFTKFKIEFLLYLKISLPIIFLAGIIFSFFPEKNYNEEISPGDILPSDKAAFIRKTRIWGIIYLSVSIILFIFLFIL